MNTFNNYHISFIIDNRERYIIKEMETPHFIELNPLIKYSTANLDIGDFKISIHNTHILIERKTIEDLISSIKDGRYKEQKYRLMNECRANVKVIYLIEGDIWKSKKFPPDTLFSVIVNTMIRDNIHVYISKDIQHTIMFICKIYKQIVKNKKDYINNSIQSENTSTENTSTENTSTENTSTEDTSTENTSTEDTSYAKYVKSSKKSNITPKICFINQLCQLPGISYISAKAIVEKYNTPKKFILQATYKDLLAIKNYNNRALSKSIIKTLLEFYNIAYT